MRRASQIVTWGEFKAPQIPQIAVIFSHTLQQLGLFNPPFDVMQGDYSPH